MPPTPYKGQKAVDLFGIKSADFEDYKVHLAVRGTTGVEPLDVFVRSGMEWTTWNQNGPRTGERFRAPVSPAYTSQGGGSFNKRYILSFVRWGGASDLWLYAGTFEVFLSRPPIIRKSRWGYIIDRTQIGKPYIGKVVVRSPYECRQRRIKLKRYAGQLLVDRWFTKERHEWNW